MFMPSLISHLEDFNRPGNVDVVCHRSIGRRNEQVAGYRTVSTQRHFSFVLKFDLRIAFDLVAVQVHVDWPVDLQGICQIHITQQNYVGYAGVLQSLGELFQAVNDSHSSRCFQADRNALILVHLHRHDLGNEAHRFYQHFH